MKCPFELPVKKKPDFKNKDLFRVESANGLFVSFSLKEDEVDYIVTAINSHEKLVTALQKISETEDEHFASGCGYSGLIDEIAKQALKEAEKQ